MTRRPGWLLIGLVLAFICYMLPWYRHDTAGFTTSAFDLAEWASIHPAVRSSSMQTSLLLRLPLVTLIGALALTANQFADARVRWLVRGGALLLALRLVPPSDFFSTVGHDPNYQQMAQLFTASVSLVGVAVMTFRLPAAWQDTALTGILAAGVLAGWRGLAEARTLLDNFEIAVRTGPGIVGYTLGAVVVIIIALWPWTSIFTSKQKRAIDPAPSQPAAG